MRLLHLLKELFSEMVVKKSADTIPHYYHKDFLLYTNGKAMTFDTFFKSHEQFYSTPITYFIEYDEDTFVEEGEKVAGRMWITTKRPNESPTKMEIILIVQYKEGKIYRLWELTYPDWSSLPAFK